MIKSERNLPKKKMEKFPRHSSIWIKPILGITPEPFYAVNMTPSFRSTCIFLNHNMVSPYGKRTISTPVIGVVKTPWLSMFSNKTDNLLTFASLNRKYFYHTVTLKNTKNYNLATCTPATLALSTPTKCGLIALYSTMKGLSALFFEGKHSSYQTKEPLYRSLRYWHPESQPVDRNTENKKLKKSPLDAIRDSTGIPYRGPAVSLITPFTLETTVSKMPCTSIITFGAPSHDQNILPHSGPIW